jgi:di/tricarboxylate transporter
MVIGIYFLNVKHPNAQIVMGLGVLFMAFILMPIFIYYRYKDNKYKKYIINDKKIKDWIDNSKE